MDDFSILTPLLRDELAAMVADCDRAAVANVRAGHGGPFGASLAVYNRADGTVMPVAGPACNAVLETGLAGAHAEDRVLQPPHLARLCDVLGDVGADHAIVLLASSGESCPACYAKIEIVARDLIRRGLIVPDGFVLAYGASYEDTRVVAGFNDEPYHADMAGPADARKIGWCISDEILPVPARVVMDGGAVYDAPAPRHDEQTPLLTPEVRAIYAACHAQKARGADEPWNLRGAVLYTRSVCAGPLMYAESQWANIARIVQCGGPATADEAGDMGNADFFRVVAARPYNGPGAAVCVVRIQPFETAAQHEWARLSADGAVAHYNGVEI